MTIAERLVEDYNGSSLVEEDNNIVTAYQSIVRRQIRKWVIHVNLDIIEAGPMEIEVFQFEDGSLAIVPDMGNATAVDPSFPASERLL